MKENRQREQKCIPKWIHPSLERDKPLALYLNDEDLEKMLEDQEREDDPMLAYMKQKKKKMSKREKKVCVQVIPSNFICHFELGKVLVILGLALALTTINTDFPT